MVQPQASVTMQMHMQPPIHTLADNLLQARCTDDMTIACTHSYYTCGANSKRCNHAMQISTDATMQCNHYIPGSNACLVQSSQEKTPPNFQQSFLPLFLKISNSKSNKKLTTVQNLLQNIFK
jgi:hypothetical protein